MGKKYIVNIYSDPVEEFWNYDELIDESELHVGSGEYDFETETFEFTPEMYEEEWKYIQEDILEAILQHGEGSIRYCNRKLNIVFNIYVEEKYAPPERGKNFWHSHYQNDEDRQDLKLFDEAEEEAYYLLEEKIKEIENERGVSIEYESKVLPEDPDPDADFYVGDYSFVIYHEGEKYEYKGDGVYFASRQNGSCFNASGDYLEYIYTSEEVKESAEEFKARMLQFIDNIHLFNSDLLIKVFDGDKHVATVERKNDKYTVTYNEKFTKLFFYILRDEVEDSLPFNKLNVRGYKVIVSALEEVKMALKVYIIVWGRGLWEGFGRGYWDKENKKLKDFIFDEFFDEKIEEQKESIVEKMEKEIRKALPRKRKIDVFYRNNYFKIAIQTE